MYNRYIPENSGYTPVEPLERERGAFERFGGKGKLSPESLLKRLRLDKLDSGDILLALIVLLLWKDSEDTDLLLAFGGAMLLGDGED